MPTIEVLPSSSTSSGPNWTYSNLPPALAHRNSLPTANTRVRATRTNNTENSAARQRQINSRILELEADNWRDVSIPVPARRREGGRATRPTKSTSTQNVRRVLASQKTFANHLADADALLSTHTTTTATTATTTHAPHHHHHHNHNHHNHNHHHRPRRATSPSSDTDMASADSDSDSSPPHSHPHPLEPEAAFPLGYTASAAAPSARPKRVFCEICGYWGRYRCQKCAARYCGLECGGVHAETRCNKFYA